jgi:ATP-dependent DNA ligase
MAGPSKRRSTAAAIAKLSARALVLDGEAIFDERLRSRFDWLREPDGDAVATPPMFMAFDLLHQDGRELTGRPLRDRPVRLESAVAGSEFVLPVCMVSSWPPTRGITTSPSPARRVMSPTTPG